MRLPLRRQSPLRWVVLPLLLLLSIGRPSLAQTAPVTGTTSFTGAANFTVYVNAQVSGTTAFNPNNNGWDFTAYSTGPVTIQARAGTTAYTYGVLGPGDPFINAGRATGSTSTDTYQYTRVKANNGSSFALQSVSLLSATNPSATVTLTLTGYKAGVAVPGATLSQPGPQLTWVQFNVSSNSAFQNVDEFRGTVSGLTGSTVAGQVSVDEITIATAVLPATAFTLSTSALSGSSFCAGSAISVSFTASTAPNSGNVYTAQLSDASGSFAAPLSLGTLASTAASGTISGTLPANTLPGTGYRGRVVASTPATTGTDNGTNLTVTNPAAPTGTASQSFSSGATVATLAATGTALQWYAAGTGGPALASTTTLTNGTGYYATQTVGGCESQTRLAVTATVTTGPTALTVSTGTLASPTSIPAGTYTTVTVTGNAILGGAVGITTGLTVQGGGSLSTNCQPLTGAGSFTLAAGATLSVCDPNGLSASGASGAVQVTGTRAFSSDALYTYVGSAAQATGPGLPATVRSLSLTNAAGLTLTQDVAVTTALAVTTGVLTTGSQRVTLGSAATLSETETAFVVGTVAATRALAPGAAEAFGGLGLTLAPATGSTNPGSTLVVRTTGTALMGAGSSVSVLRCFDIQPAVNAGLNVALTFGYFTHELNGIAPANLALFKSENGAAGPWANQRPVTLSAGTNTVGKAGLASFSLWTLGNALAPLPVELTAFTAERQGEAARLAWATASGKNSAYFEVEASPDGARFGVVGRVAGQGSTAQRHDYELRDPHLRAYGAPVVYYRLRQVDLDGTTVFSPVRALTAAAGAAPAKLVLFPNPAHGRVQWGAPAEVPALLLDLAGRRVRAAPAGAWALDLAGVPAGVYLLRCGAQSARLAVE